MHVLGCAMSEHSTRRLKGVGCAAVVCKLHVVSILDVTKPSSGLGSGSHST